MSIILTIIIFSIVVLIHEGGHFFMARKNGIFVEEFAIGMGPILLKYQGPETLYSVRLFPIGGFCRMLGEDDGCTDPRAFSNKSVRARIEVVIAGVVMNLILGLIIFFGLMSYEGFYSTTVSNVKVGYPAEQAGLLAGDEILELNGDKILSYNFFSYKMSSVDPENVSLLVKRNDEEILLNMNLIYDEDYKMYMMGFSPSVRVGHLRSNEFLNQVQENFSELTTIAPQKASILETLKQTIFLIFFYFYASITSIISLFTGSLGLSAMSGPIGIVSVVGSEYQAAAAVGVDVIIMSMLNLTGTLSLALAVFNILPIPALDGGRLIFLIIEGLRGKPIDPEKEGKVHFVGFALLMLLAVVVAFSDITKLF